MTSNNKQHVPDDPEKKGKSTLENEHAAHMAFDRPQQYMDADDEESRETEDDADNADGDGGAPIDTDTQSSD